MHAKGWDSEDRRELRPDLTAREAAEVITRQLAEKGYLDPGKLEEELG
jgi:hypothetical protein